MNDIDMAEWKRKRKIMEITRVKTEASKNIYSMTHRNALAIWNR